MPKLNFYVSFGRLSAALWADSIQGFFSPIRAGCPGLKICPSDRIRLKSRERRLFIQKRKPLQSI